MQEPAGVPTVEIYHQQGVRDRPVYRAGIRNAFGGVERCGERILGGCGCGSGERGEGFYVEGRPLEKAKGDVEGFLGGLRGIVKWVNYKSHMRACVTE